jgi:hypothetical protein
MCRDSPPVRARIRQNHPCRDRGRFPSAGGGDPGREATSTVHRRHQIAHVDQQRLQFDDQQRPSRGVPRHDVDHATLAVIGERDLRCYLPAEGCQLSGHEFVKSSMPSVQHLVEVAASPPEDRVEPDLEGVRDLLERVDGHPPDVPVLDPDDRGPGHAGTRGDVLLPQAQLQSDGSIRHADPDAVHGGRL